MAIRRTKQSGALLAGADFKWVPAKLGGVNSNLEENCKPGVSVSKTNKRKQLTKVKVRAVTVIMMGRD